MSNPLPNHLQAVAVNVIDMAEGNKDIRVAANEVMRGRTTYGHSAAVVAALSVFWLVRRGKPDLAEALIRAIAKRGLID